MTWRNLTSAAVVVGLCGGALAAGTVWQQGHPDAQTAQTGQADASVREFLRSAKLVCPGVVSPDDAIVVAAASIPGTPGQDVPGEVTATVDGKPQGSITQPGATVVSQQRSVGKERRVSAEGGLAPGLVTAMVTTDDRGEGKGLWSAPCLAAGAESWLLGGGGSAGQRSVLLLANPTESDSLVDVTAFGKGGRLEATGDDGVTVPAGETVPVRLDALVPDTEAVAVRVRTRVGLVAASISDERMNGLTPMGSDILTDAGPPQRTQILAGMPGGAGGRELHLLASEGKGSVRITALTENGPLPLLAGEPVALTAGNLTVFDLTKELGGRPAALRISGDVKFVAGVGATTAVDESIRARRAAEVEAAETALEYAKGDAERSEAEAALTKAETANAIDPGEDFAWFGPAPAIPTRTAVTGLDPDLDATVMLSAVGGPATVEVALLPAGRTGATPRKSRKVEVPEGATVPVPVVAPAGAAYTAVVTRRDGSGQLHVGHVQLANGRSLTGYALVPLPVWIPATRAQPDYGN